MSRDKCVHELAARCLARFLQSVRVVAGGGCRSPGRDPRWRLRSGRRALRLSVAEGDGVQRRGVAPKRIGLSRRGLRAEGARRLIGAVAGLRAQLREPAECLFKTQDAQHAAAEFDGRQRMADQAGSRWL